MKASWRRFNLTNKQNTENRIYSFLGLAKRAGKLLSGDDTCERALKTDKALLVIVSKDASLNTSKKFSDMCKYRRVEIRYFGYKEFIGRYIGKEIRSVVAITDNGFARRLIELIDSYECECGGGQIVKV